MHSKSLTTYLNQTVWHRLASIIVFAAITALAARITIHLPFTPVPITLQTLAVVLSGLVLGVTPKRGMEGARDGRRIRDVRT